MTLRSKGTHLERVLCRILSLLVDIGYVRSLVAVERRKTGCGGGTRSRAVKETLSLARLLFQLHILSPGNPSLLDRATGSDVSPQDEQGFARKQRTRISTADGHRRRQWMQRYPLSLPGLAQDNLHSTRQ